MAKAKKAVKKGKKRASKYEEKLAVNLTFEELVKVSLSPPKSKKGKS